MEDSAAPLVLTYTPPFAILPSWLSYLTIPTQTVTAYWTYGTDQVGSITMTQYLTEVIQLPMTVSVPDGYPLEFPYTTAGGVGTLTLESVLGATGFYTVGGAPSPSPTIADSPIAASGIANFATITPAPAIPTASIDFSGLVISPTLLASDVNSETAALVTPFSREVSSFAISLSSTSVSYPSVVDNPKDTTELRSSSTSPSTNSSSTPSIPSLTLSSTLIFSSASSPTFSARSSNLSVAQFVGIIVGCVLVALILLVICILCICLRRRRRGQASSTQAAHGSHGYLQDHFDGHGEKNPLAGEIDPGPVTMNGRGGLWGLGGLIPVSTEEEAEYGYEIRERGDVDEGPDRGSNDYIREEDRSEGPSVEPMRHLRVINPSLEERNSEGRSRKFVQPTIVIDDLGSMHGTDEGSSSARPTLSSRQGSGSGGTKSGSGGTGSSTDGRPGRAAGGEGGEAIGIPAFNSRPQNNRSSFQIPPLLWPGDSPQTATAFKVTSQPPLSHIPHSGPVRSFHSREPSTPADEGERNLLLPPAFDDVLEGEHVSSEQSNIGQRAYDETRSRQVTSQENLFSTPSSRTAIPLPTVPPRPPADYRSPSRLTYNPEEPQFPLQPTDRNSLSLSEPSSRKERLLASIASLGDKPQQSPYSSNGSISDTGVDTSPSFIARDDDVGDSPRSQRRFSTISQAHHAIVQDKGRNARAVRIGSANDGGNRARSTSSGETRKTRGSSIASGRSGGETQSHVAMAARKQHYGLSGNEENEEHIFGEHFRF